MSRSVVPRPAALGMLSGTHGAGSAMTPRTSLVARFAHAEDVVDVAGFEITKGGGADHAAVGNDANARAIRKRVLSRSITGNRVVTSVVLPGPQL